VNIRNIWEIFDTVMENCNSFDIFWTRAALKLSENFCEKSSLPILSITYYCTNVQKKTLDDSTNTAAPRVTGSFWVEDDLDGLIKDIFETLLFLC